MNKLLASYESKIRTYISDNDITNAINLIRICIAGPSKRIGNTCYNSQNVGFRSVNINYSKQVTAYKKSIINTLIELGADKTTAKNQVSKLFKS